MDIKSPRRILFLGPPDSGVLGLLKDLTGSAPQPHLVPSSPPATTQSEAQVQSQPESEYDATTATTAGLTHALSLKNAYYTATIPIWLDEPIAPADWKADFLSPEAGEVVRAVGAWVLVFRLNGPASSASASGSETRHGASWVVEMMEAVKEVVAEAHGGAEEAWDGVLLCVGVPGYVAGAASAAVATSETATGEQGSDLEDLCWARGFEFVDASLSGDQPRDENGEARGVKRVLEALEANDWNGEDEDEDALGLLDDEGEEFGAWEAGLGGVGEEDTGFTLERREVEREMMDLKIALNTNADDSAEGDEQRDDEEKMQLEEFEGMMAKTLAVRDMTANMQESERKKFAARAVNDIMKTT